MQEKPKIEQSPTQKLSSIKKKFDTDEDDRATSP